MAVLLVSAHFLGSDFVRKEEVPRLLARRQAGNVQVLPLLLTQCDWTGVPWLEALQLHNLNGQPLQAMAEAARNDALAALARHLRTTCTAMSSHHAPGSS